jgi:hypothetical protein
MVICFELIFWYENKYFYDKLNNIRWNIEQLFEVSILK